MGAGSREDFTPDDLHGAIAALLPDLRAFARFLVRGRGEADDLVQDTLVRALSALAQFAPGTHLKAWLFTILRNTFYEQARRRRREHAALQQQRPAEPGPLHQAGAAEIAELDRLLWRLPPVQREALVLVGAQELTYEEAAAICAVPVGTMKARVSRGRHQLARLAAGEEALPAAEQ